MEINDVLSYIRMEIELLSDERKLKSDTFNRVRIASKIVALDELKVFINKALKKKIREESLEKDHVHV